MPTVFRATALLLPFVALGLTSGCAWMPHRDKGALPPPNPPIYCYDTLGRAACYDQPQIGLGDLINVQLPPTIVVEQPVIIVPTVTTTATVLTPAQVEAIPDTATAVVTASEEPPIIIKTPDPYPEPGDRAAPFTDAPVPLKAPAHH